MTSLDRLLRSGKVESFGTASGADIDRYEATFSVGFSQAYRAFLESCNGMRTDFEFDEVEDAGLHMALADINTFYGIGNGRDYADLALMTPRIDANGKELLKFAPSIAVGGDFCTYVEITKGTYDGQVMYTDGELYWGYFREAGIDWRDPPDELVERFVADGFFMPVAATFDDLLDMYAKLL